MKRRSTLFDAAFERASESAKEQVAALAVGEKLVHDATARLVQNLADEAHVIARTARKTGEDLVEISREAGQSAKEAIAWCQNRISQAGSAVGARALEAEAVAASRIKDAFRGVGRFFSEAAAGLGKAVCAAWNWSIAGISLAAGSILTKPVISHLLRPLLGVGGDSSQKQYDGMVLGAGCKKESSDGHGMMPPECKQPTGKLPKIVYVNGISTPYKPPKKNGDGICKTMRLIAEGTCSEVTGVYNATEGFGKDVDECIDNINKASDSKAVDPLKNAILQAAIDKRPTRIFAHSQGGLITQEAIASAKRELEQDEGLTSEEAEQRLENVEIVSFGTAILGWPKGPRYQRYTNTADPIPPMILGTQTSYPTSTLGDSATAERHHVFTKPHLNPIDSHSMDATYLKEYQTDKGAKTCACGTS